MLVDNMLDAVVGACLIFKQEVSGSAGKIG